MRFIGVEVEQETSAPPPFVQPVMVDFVVPTLCPTEVLLRLAF